MFHPPVKPRPMDPPETLLGRTHRQVERGREIIAAQRDRIERLRAIGCSTVAAETMLAQFLSVQASLEAVSSVFGPQLRSLGNSPF